MRKPPADSEQPVSEFVTRWRKWSPERNAIVQRDWPAMRLAADILREINELPGPAVLPRQLAAQARGVLGLSRPKGIRKWEERIKEERRLDVELTGELARHGNYTAAFRQPAKPAARADAATTARTGPFTMTAMTGPDPRLKQYQAQAGMGRRGRVLDIAYPPLTGTGWGG